MSLKQPLLDHQQEETSDKLDADEKGPSELVFGAHLLRAFMTSLFVLICATPVLSPTIYASLDPNWGGMISATTLCMIPWTVYSNLGVTLQQAYQGFAGTGLACLFAHCQRAIFPWGAGDPDTWQPALAHFLNIGFIFCGMWLNMAKCFRMFMLGYYVYFAVDWFNPSICTNPDGKGFSCTTIYNDSWAINWDAYPVTTIGTASVGLISAILVMLLPMPITAVHASASAATDSVEKLGDLMEALTDYFNRSSPSMKIFQLQIVAKQLQDKIETMNTDLDACWWEHLDIGAKGRSREYLYRHVVMCRKMCDTIFALQVCISKEDFGETHVSCMAGIKAEVYEVLKVTKDLLVEATNCAQDGTIEGHERDALQAKTEAVNNAVLDLAKKFNEIRKAVSPNEVITEALQSEHFFVFCVSAYSRRATDYATDMCKRETVPRPDGPIKAVFKAWKSTFDTNVLIGGFNIHSFAMRNSITTLIAFYYGFNYLGMSAIPSCTTAVLISNFTGSALQKNLGRLQGVVIGNIGPILMQKMIGAICSTKVIVLQVCGIMFWEILTSFVYYSSPTYGYIGCIISAFGIPLLVYPCSNETGAAYQAAEDALGAFIFLKIQQTTIGVIIMTLVDMILLSERASTGAVQRFLEGLLAMEVGVKATFVRRKASGKMSRGDKKKYIIDNENKTMLLDDERERQSIIGQTSKREVGFILGKLSLADGLGGEADKEPRYQRAAWPLDYFQALVRLGYVQRANLNIIESTLAGPNGDYRPDPFLCIDPAAGGNPLPAEGPEPKSIRNFETYHAMQKDLLVTTEKTMKMIGDVLRNETNMKLPQVIATMEELEKANSLEGMPDLMKSINESGLQYPEEMTKSLEHDDLCRLNVLLMTWDAMAGTLSDMVKESIKMVASD